MPATEANRRRTEGVILEANSTLVAVPVLGPRGDQREDIGLKIPSHASGSVRVLDGLDHEGHPAVIACPSVRYLRLLEDLQKARLDRIGYPIRSRQLDDAARKRGEARAVHRRDWGVGTPRRRQVFGAHDVQPDHGMLVKALVDLVPPQWAGNVIASAPEGTTMSPASVRSRQAGASVDGVGSVIAESANPPFRSTIQTRSTPGSSAGASAGPLFRHQEGVSGDEVIRQRRTPTT